MHRYRKAKGESPGFEYPAMEGLAATADYNIESMEKSARRAKKVNARKRNSAPYGELRDKTAPLSEEAKSRIATRVSFSNKNSTACVKICIFLIYILFQIGNAFFGVRANSRQKVSQWCLTTPLTPLSEMRRCACLRNDWKHWCRKSATGTLHFC
jgi:hypothetical protein